MHYPSPINIFMKELQGEGHGSREDSSISKVNRLCLRTPIHPSLTSLSTSKLMSYINEIITGEIDVEKVDGKGVIYIHTQPLQPL